MSESEKERRVKRVLRDAEVMAKAYEKLGRDGVEISNEATMDQFHSAIDDSLVLLISTAGPAVTLAIMSDLANWSPNQIRKQGNGTLDLIRRWAICGYYESYKRVAKRIEEIRKEQEDHES